MMSEVVRLTDVVIDVVVILIEYFFNHTADKDELVFSNITSAMKS